MKRISNTVLIRKKKKTLMNHAKLFQLTSKFLRGGGGGESCVLHPTNCALIYPPPPILFVILYCFLLFCSFCFLFFSYFFLFFFQFHPRKWRSRETRRIFMRARKVVLYANRVVAIPRPRCHGGRVEYQYPRRKTVQSPVCTVAFYLTWNCHWI